MRNQASLTAEYMALFRALESLHKGDARLFSDPIAQAFLNGPRRWLYRVAQVPQGLRAVEWLLDHKAPGARAAGVARTRWIDDQVTSIALPARQLVVLGAGFDSRPYRLPGLRGLNVFEVDHPETSQSKQAVLKRVIKSVPGNVRFVGIDFNNESLDAVLSTAGFDQAQPACFIWEGVTNYLSDAAVDTVLRYIRGSVAGSLLLFTYIHRGVLDDPRAFFAAEELTRRVESYGEPWTFGLYPDKVSDYLAQRGLQLIEDTGVAEAWQQFRGPTDAVRGYEFYRLASARVG